MIKTFTQQKEIYLEQLKDPKWFAKRVEIIERDNNQCQNCGASQNLRVHHKQYHTIRRGNVFQKPWNYDNQKLITLCSDCHSHGHNNYKVPVFFI